MCPKEDTAYLETHVASKFVEDNLVMILNATILIIHLCNPGRIMIDGLHIGSP
jgi:hypothetical protein